MTQEVPCKGRQYFKSASNLQEKLYQNNFVANSSKEIKDQLCWLTKSKRINKRRNNLYIDSYYKDLLKFAFDQIMMLIIFKDLIIHSIASRNKTENPKVPNQLLFNLLFNSVYILFLYPNYHRFIINNFLDDMHYKYSFHFILCGLGLLKLKYECNNCKDKKYSIEKKNGKHLKLNTIYRNCTKDKSEKIYKIFIFSI